MNIIKSLQLNSNRIGCTWKRQEFRTVAPIRIRKYGLVVVNTNPETETEASPLDYPQEWVTPQPSRRPDTQPEFERLETPMPKPMPGDPEQPEEEEAEEEEKRNPDKQPDKEDDEEDPDKDEPQPDTPDTPPE
eukprot:TRINITY_DN37940_c0_g3_i1.p3 TRINITY_DN37940_c0_g3~~TRINITY_DN37940_c0_g3_i1.p3  ORF type:complete len:142 (-),score=28.54 TRINITY_DN37940_c0_g3_i1:479-877(-)